jgi:hypothetical protein
MRITRTAKSLVLVSMALLAMRLASQGPAAQLSDLAWISGSWESDVGGVRSIEHWAAPDGGMLIGMSRTVTDGKPTEFEFLRIESRPDGIFYVAQPQGRPPVDFRLTGLRDGTATFSNPGTTDHLDRIIYRRGRRDSLFARIEGRNGGKPFAVDYAFVASRR